MRRVKNALPVRSIVLLSGALFSVAIAILLYQHPAQAQANGNVVEVIGVSSNDVLNVRSGPGTNYRMVGALANGDRVRRLRCQQVGSSRWCQIKMMTDMRGRG
jgi:uncharacterized protein YraI